MIVLMIVFIFLFRPDSMLADLTLKEFLREKASIQTL